MPGHHVGSLWRCDAGRVRRGRKQVRGRKDGNSKGTKAEEPAIKMGADKGS